jgi:hypothetical protein
MARKFQNGEPLLSDAGIILPAALLAVNIRSLVEIVFNFELLRRNGGGNAHSCLTG